MKKRIISSLVLFLFLTSNIFSVDFSVIPKTMKSFGYYDNLAFKPINPPDRSLTVLAGKGVGGVAFAGTAIPAGNAIGKPVTLRYDSSENDGKRLKVLIGSTVINSGLYDWEWVPLLRFADGNSWVCMSLTGGRKEEEEPPNLLLKEKEAKVNDANRVLWASYAPGLGNTFVGFNLLMVDAMFVTSKNNRVNQDTINLLDKDFPIIPGFNDKPLAQTGTQVLWGNIIPSKNWDSTLQNAWNSLLKEPYHTYIFSDDGVPITYQIKSNNIEFTGFPYYQFMKGKLEFNFYRYYRDNLTKSPKDFIWTIMDPAYERFKRMFRNSYNKLPNYEQYMELNFELLHELNNHVRENYSVMKALNPYVYEAAEKWCRWTALFRTVKETNKEEWNQFFNLVKEAYPYNPDKPEQTKYPQPSFATPRLWIVPNK